jgi:tRNA_anti-like
MSRRSAPLCALVFIAGCSSPWSATRNAQVDFELSSDVLIEAYKTNLVGAEQKYVGKTATVSGFFRHTYRGEKTGNTYLSVVPNVDMPRDTVACELDPDDKEQMSQVGDLGIGDTIRIKGVVKTSSSESPLLVGCLLLPAKPPN